MANMQQSEGEAQDLIKLEKRAATTDSQAFDESRHSSNAAHSSKDVFDSTGVDPVLTKKMALVNAAIDEIGMTPWHWNLFFLNGFGYAVDSTLIVCQAIAQPAVTREYGSPNPPLAGVALASQIGLLVGAALWGFSADVIGRKLAFNTSLLSCAIFVVIAGAMPSYISFSAMVAIYSAGAGGNYILDAINFLEFLPRSHTYLVTLMSVWWALGYTVTGLLAWGFMSNFSCLPDATPETCTHTENMGWRYLHFTSGSIVLIVAALRVLVMRMPQTPKWLCTQNKDQEAYHLLVDLAKRYSRPFTLRLDSLQSQGQVLHTEKSAWSSLRLRKHISSLFETKLLAYSTSMIIANWFTIGMVSPLYAVFLPYYLNSRGAAVGTSSNYITWRNYAINQVSGLAGPIIAAFLVQTHLIGRRGTLAIGAAITTVLQIGYTQIETPAQNLALSCSITAASSVYYGTIYAYTPEIPPTAHRATAYGLCVVMNRVGGIVGVVVGSYADVRTTTPLFVCAGLFGLLVVLALALPFETRGRRSI